MWNFGKINIYVIISKNLTQHNKDFFFLYNKLYVCINYNLVYEYNRINIHNKYTFCRCN